MFQPVNLAIDSSGRLFVTDFGDNTVKVFDNPSDLETPSIVLTGFNFNEKTFSFLDVVIKPEVVEEIEGEPVVTQPETLFVSDPFNHAVKVYSISEDSLELVATLGGFGSGDSQFNQPSGLALNEDGSELHVVDTVNHRISVWSAEAPFIHISNYGGPGHGDSSGLYYPTDILHVGAGVMYVADCGHNRVVSFESNGTASTPYVVKKLDEYVGHSLNSSGVLTITTNTFPVISLIAHGTNFYLSDLYVSNIVEFDSTWTQDGIVFLPYGDGEEKVKFPKGMYVSNDTLYVADTASSEIEAISLI